MKKITTDEFIKKSNEMHKNKYDYSLSIYAGALNKVAIICPIHGKFEQRAYEHMNGANCNECAHTYDINNIRKNSQINFLKRGDRFGRWTVLNEIFETKFYIHPNNPLKKEKRYYVDVKCDCGTQERILSKTLLRGYSSGCNFCKHLGHKPIWIDKRTGKQKSSETLWGQYFHNLKKSALARKKEFNLTLDYLKNLLKSQENKCVLTGDFICLEDHTASLDRIDSSKGYIIGNVQFLNLTVNRMKWTASQEEFISFCHKISEKFPKNYLRPKSAQMS